MASYYADSVVALSLPGAFLGREANRALFAGFFAQPGATHPITTDSIWASSSGDVAYSLGRFHVSIPASAKVPEAAERGGRYLAVWRPVGPNGAWQIVAMSGNVYTPPPAM
jgi:ketosteroid isomerase-like protein